MLITQTITVWRYGEENKKKKSKDCLEQLSHPYKFYRWKRVKRGVCVGWVGWGNDCSAI